MNGGFADMVIPSIGKARRSRPRFPPFDWILKHPLCAAVGGAKLNEGRLTVVINELGGFVFELPKKPVCRAKRLCPLNRATLSGERASAPTLVSRIFAVNGYSSTSIHSQREAANAARDRIKCSR